MKETSRRGGPGLAAYLLEIQRFPLLTSDQEAQAVARLRNSDGEEEMHRLVQSNLRFVVKIARQYQGRSMPLEDLISLGNLGLLRAARRYEPSRGARFLSCAVWWIRKAMLEALEGGGTHVRVPRYQLQKSVEAYREAGESAGSWDRAKLRSKHLPLRERHRPHLEIALDSPLAGDSSRTLAEVLPDAGAEDPMEVLLRREARARVRRALRRLTRREIRVLSYRYGFGGRRARTLGEIGRELGVTREAVRQIEARAREKLSKLLLDEKRTRAAGSKSRGLVVRTARLRPVPSKEERSRSGRDTLSACTGSFEG